MTVKYQLQAIHTTLVHHYNDTLDMLVMSEDMKMTTVRVWPLFASLELLNCQPLITLAGKDL